MVERGEVFKQKVLKKLYSSSLLEVKTNETATKKSKAKQDEELESNKKNDGAIGMVQIVPECKKIYTVSLPPSGDVVCSTGPNEQRESQESSEEELEGRRSAEKFQRKRKRKRKLKSSVLEDFSEKTQTEFQQPGMLKTDILQTPLMLHSAKPEAEILTKNRRRKLKKKRHKEKLKAAGLVSKATAVELIYQPGEESNDDDTEDDKAIEVISLNAT